jgi:hypothetical protein
MKWPVSSGLSFGRVFTSELDAWPERGFIVSPINIESCRDIGFALSVRFVPAVGFVSC